MSEPKIELPATTTCLGCGQRFDRGEYRRRRYKPTYCSSACRQASYRRRKDIAADVPASARARHPRKMRLVAREACVTNAKNSASDTHLAPCVTRPKIPQQPQWAATPKNKRTIPRGIVPDERWPGMYRLRLPDGSLTDMMNSTRARDAYRGLDVGS
jgi:hypothetical protein